MPQFLAPWSIVLLVDGGISHHLLLACNQQEAVGYAMSNHVAAHKDKPVPVHSFAALRMSEDGMVAFMSQFATPGESN